MIAKAAFLFLFGTTLTTGQFWPHMNLAPYGIALAPTSKSSGCPSGPELAPIICKFMQQNMGFKPQLIEPSTYIAPLVVEKCDTPKLQMEIELPLPAEERKPLVIPQPPELPPITIPKFPLPVIIEEPPALPEHHSSEIAAMPVASIPAAPELPQEAVQLAPLPNAPELPEFVMPELPIRIIEQETPQPATPIIEDEPASIEPLAPLPAAPKLPAFFMTEIPHWISEQKAPMPAAPCLEGKPTPTLIPAHIEPLAPLPAAPELPPAFVMPEFPVRVTEEEMPTAAPILEDEPVPAPNPIYVEPLAPLPAAPKLPAFVMPEIPTPVLEEKSPMPAAPYWNDELIRTPIPTYVAPFPAAPELPPYEIPDFAVRVAEYPIPAAPFQPIPTYYQPLPEFNYNTVDYQPMSVPQPPEFPAFVMSELPSYKEPTAMHVETLAPIPTAPVLPPAPLPEFPVRVEIPSAPATIEQPCEEPTLAEKPTAKVDYNTIEYQPMVVPQPPELPTFVMPELPVRIAEQELPKPIAPYEPLAPIVVPEFIEPLAPVPAAPELPPPSLPEFPLRVEFPSENPEEIAAPESIKIPQAPLLPEQEMPALPVKIAIEEHAAPCAPTFVMPSPFYEKLFVSHFPHYNEKDKEMQNMFLPNQPIQSSAFPVSCVYNLVMQHVLPNMIPHNFRPTENMAIQPAPYVPCS